MRLWKKRLQTKASENDSAEYRRETMITEKSDFAVVEAYKAARTNLMFLKGQEKCPVLLFTSAVPGEGKTTTCINMGIAFAQAGFRTLVIGADMRKPQLHKFFEFPMAPGLSDFLGGLTEELNIHDTPYPNLHVLTGGTLPPNPAELLTGKRMDQLLEQLKGQFDYVFFDTPPVLLVTDALILSQKCTAVVLTVRQNVSYKDTVAEAADRLNQVQANIAGVILGDYSMRAASYKSYRYDQKYDYRSYEYTHEDKQNDSKH